MLLVQLSFCTHHIYKLTDPEPTDKEMEDAADENLEQLVKNVSGHIGDIIYFDLPADQPSGDNAGLVEWVFLEGMMGREGEIYSLRSESMKIEDDGSRIYTFGFKLLKEGVDVLSFVNGDVSKIDDAIDSFYENNDKVFSVADMKGHSYSQVKLTALK